MAFQLRFIVMHYAIAAIRNGAALGVSLLLGGVASVTTPAVAEPREVGVWYDDTGKGAVKIEICTPTTLCGKIYWLKEPMNAEGKPKTDRYNPDPSMRNRAICGLPVLGDLEQMSEGGFDNGWVYDPKEGRSYSVALDLVTGDQLKVTGYKGMRFLGKSFMWTRAPSDLQSCSSDTAKNNTPAVDKATAKTKEAKVKDGSVSEVKTTSAKAKTTTGSKDGKSVASKPSDAKIKEAKASKPSDGKSAAAKPSDSKATVAKSADGKTKIAKAKDDKKTASTKKPAGTSKVETAGSAPNDHKKAKADEADATQQPPVVSN